MKAEIIQNPFQNVDIQWFADGEVSEEEIIESEKPQIQFEESEETMDEIEVLVPGRDQIPEETAEADEFKDLKREDLIRKLRDQQGQINEIQARVDPVGAITTGLNQLNENLTKQRTPIQQAPIPQQPVDPKERKKHFNETMLDDPYENVKALVIEEIIPQIQQFLPNNLAYSRELTKNDPDVQFVLKEYPAEVDQVLNEIEPIRKARDPGVFMEAVNRVRGRHFNEIFEKKQAERDAELKKTQTQAKKPLAFNETSQRPAAKKKPLIATDEDRFEAAAIGMDLEYYMRTKYGKTG